MQQLLGVEAVLVFDEIIPQAAVGEILHDEPEVPASCREEKEEECAREVLICDL